MPSRPITAWSLRSPWGSTPRSILDALVSGREVAGRVVSTEPALDEVVVEALGVAARRWGPGRVGAIYGVSPAIGAAGPWHQQEIRGPVYALSSFGVTGHLLHSGLSLLTSNRADAVLLATAGSIVQSSVLIEKHGKSDVRLWPSAQSKPDATFCLRQAPHAGPPPVADVVLSQAADVLGAVALASGCLQAGLHPANADAEADRINVADGDSAFSIEVAT